MYFLPAWECVRKVATVQVRMRRAFDAGRGVQVRMRISHPVGSALEGTLDFLVRVSGIGVSAGRGIPPLK